MHEAFYATFLRVCTVSGETLRRSAISAFFLPSKANCMMALIWVGSFSTASDRIRKVSSSTIASRKKHLLLAIIFARIHELPSNTQVRSRHGYVRPYKEKLSPDEDKRNRLLSATAWQIRLVLYLLTYPHPPCIGTRKNSKAPHNILKNIKKLLLIQLNAYNRVIYLFFIRFSAIFMLFGR